MRISSKRIISAVLTAALLTSVCALPNGVVASAEGNRPLKILAIGNSYSNNATQYISDIAESMGLEITAASLYYQGCTLERHVTHYETYETLGHDAYYAASNNYKYENFYVNGTGILENLSIQEAVAYTDWDYITLQQMPNGCDDIKTYWTVAKPWLTKLYDYVNAELKKTGNKKCEILLHQGWSFSHAMSIDNAYKYYPVDYENTKDFYNAIESTVNEAANILKTHAGLSAAPDQVLSGKAMQLLKDEFGFSDSYGESNSLYADYISHLSPMARYMVACVWIETFAAKAGLSVTDTRTATFVPTDAAITKETADILRSCAHEAVTGESDTLYGEWRAVPYGSGLMVVSFKGEVPENGTVTVPAELNGKTIFKVDDNAFKYVEGVTSVVMEKNDKVGEKGDSDSSRNDDEGQNGGKNIGFYVLLALIILAIVAVLVGIVFLLINLKKIIGT